MLSSFAVRTRAKYEIWQCSRDWDVHMWAVQYVCVNKVPSASCLAMRSCSSRTFFSSSSILLSSAAIGFRWSEQIRTFIKLRWKKKTRSFLIYEIQLLSYTARSIEEALPNEWKCLTSLHYTAAVKDSSSNNLPYLLLPYMIPAIKAEYLAVCKRKCVHVSVKNSIMSRLRCKRKNTI